MRFTPAETLREHARRAERLLAEIEGDRSYPEDFVVFRITNYRPRATGELPAHLVGAAVLADLTALISRLTERAPLDPAAEGREPVSIPALAEEIGVSDRTLRRWRPRGLAMHWTTAGLICFRDAWDRFAARHSELVDRARRFRPGSAQERHGLARATGHLVATGMSRSAAHAAVAEAADRSPATVRAASLRLDEALGTDAGGPRRPDTARAGRLAFRADAAGIPIDRIADRLGRSPASVRRLIRGVHVQALHRLDLAGPILPTFSRPDAEEVLLGAAAAREGLLDLPPVHRPMILLSRREQWAEPGSPSEVRTRQNAMAAARAFLRWRARTRLAEPAIVATARGLDRVETDLRWSILLGRRLAGTLLPAAIAPIEQALGGPLHRQPTEALGFWLLAAMEVAARVALSLDPAADASPERRTRWAMERRIAADGMALRDEARAAARHSEDLDPGLRWRGLEPAPPFLEPVTAVEVDAMLPDLPSAERTLLQARLGLHGQPPATAEQLAVTAGTTPEAITRRLRRLGRALAAGR